MARIHGNNLIEVALSSEEVLKLLSTYVDDCYLNIVLGDELYIPDGQNIKDLRIEDGEIIIGITPA